MPPVSSKREPHADEPRGRPCHIATPLATALSPSASSPRSTPGPAPPLRSRPTHCRPYQRLRPSCCSSTRPYLSHPDGRRGLGECDRVAVPQCIILFVASRLAGTLIAQLIFLPAAGVVAAVAELYDGPRGPFRPSRKMISDAQPPPVAAPAAPGGRPARSSACLPVHNGLPYLDESIGSILGRRSRIRAVISTTPRPTGRERSCASGRARPTHPALQSPRRRLSKSSNAVVAEFGRLPSRGGGRRRRRWTSGTGSGGSGR